MPRVNGNTMIFSCSSFPNERPVPVLFPQVKSGGVGDEEFSDDPSGETEPAYYPESGLSIDVVVQDSGNQGSEFTGGGRETVGGSSD